MRSMESIGIEESCGEVSSFSEIRTPSTSTSVFSLPVMPNPLRSSCWFGEPALSRTWSKPNCASISGRLDDELARMSALLMMLTPTARSRLASLKRVAVTTTASSLALARIETTEIAAAKAVARKRESRTESSPAPSPTPKAD